MYDKNEKGLIVYVGPLPLSDYIHFQETPQVSLPVVVHTSSGWVTSKNYTFSGLIPIILGMANVVESYLHHIYTQYFAAFI